MAIFIYLFLMTIFAINFPIQQNQTSPYPVVLFLTSRWQQSSMNTARFSRFDLLLLLCSRHRPHYSFRLHSHQPSEEPRFPFFNCCLFWKLNAENRCRSAGVGKDERLEMRKMKRANKVKTRRRQKLQQRRMSWR